MRRLGNVVPFTSAENDIICKLSWQAWDWLVDLLARASADVLRGFVAEPERLVENRAKIAVVAQDVVLVYLDLSIGRVLVRVEALDEIRKRQLAKILRKEDRAEAFVELTGVQKPGDAEGASRREKNRLTLFMRQALLGLWDVSEKMP